MATRSPSQPILVSYITLRRIVGALGMFLPFGLVGWGWRICGCQEIRPSISDYYSGRTGDLFVGALFTIAWFLFAYRGPERQDDIAGDFAWLFALGVAFIPHDDPAPWSTVHLISAGALFLTLAYFSLVLFTKTGGSLAAMTAQKVTRNRVYRLCALVMVACIGVIGAYKLKGWTWAVGPLPAVFTFETLALWAFGISWFVKGETLWKDA
ncbi:MAG: DUF998 domain-containing protein [Gemmatimonadales bacterium]